MLRQAVVLVHVVTAALAIVVLLAMVSGVPFTRHAEADFGGFGIAMCESHDDDHRPPSSRSTAALTFAETIEASGGEELLVAVPFGALALVALELVSRRRARRRDQPRSVGGALARFVGVIVIAGVALVSTFRLEIFERWSAALGEHLAWVTVVALFCGSAIELITIHAAATRARFGSMPPPMRTVVDRGGATRAGR